MEMKLKNNKRGIMDQLVGLAVGVVVLTVVAVLGITMLANISGSLGCSGVVGLNGEATTYNQTTGLCHNVTTAAVTYSATLGGRSGHYAEGYLGSSTGGLLTYLPVIIPAVVIISILGLLFGLWKFGNTGSV